MARTKSAGRLRLFEFFRAGMHGRRSTPPASASFILLGAIAFASASGYSGNALAAAKLKVLYSFSNVTGAGPETGLIADSAGNLYGTTNAGGKFDSGVVFELSPRKGAKKTWAETILHSFHGKGGIAPEGPLLADASGNLYGSSSFGGDGRQRNGVVFKLSSPPQGQTAWTETVLRSFKKDTGSGPYGGLISDGAGNLYGATCCGGPIGDGVVFELSPPIAGQKAWPETVLDVGGDYTGGLITDGAGNLYGATEDGGANGDGAVFELSPPIAGQTLWTETELHSFKGTDGLNPGGGLVADGAGNLYGVTGNGGANGDGVVFELSPPIAGQTAWTQTVLYSFDGADGKNPVGGLIADGMGNLYGATGNGGANGDGAVFELSPPTEGQTAWTETALKSFDGLNGQQPVSVLISDGAGDFYGTTMIGGANAVGVVFEFTP